MYVTLASPLPKLYVNTSAAKHPLSGGFEFPKTRHNFAISTRLFFFREMKYAPSLPTRPKQNFKSTRLTINY